MTEPVAQSPAQWWVYLIVNPKGHTYVGATLGPSADRRVAEHNSGLSRAAKATRGQGPWTLAHAEPAPDKHAALSREWHLKQDRKARRGFARITVAKNSANWLKEQRSKE